MARQIKARAIRRGGELLLQLKSQQGGDRKSKGAKVPFDRKTMAKNAGLFTRPEAAQGADVPYDTAVDWERRLLLFASPLKERLRQQRGKPMPPRPPHNYTYTLAEVCLLRAIRIMTQGGIAPRDAIPWAEVTLPKHFDAIINGKRKMAVAEIPDRGVKIDLVAVVREVRARLELGTVRVEPVRHNERAAP